MTNDTWNGCGPLPQRDVKRGHKEERVMLSNLHAKDWRKEYEGEIEVMFVRAIFDPNVHTIDIKNLGW